MQSILTSIKKRIVGPILEQNFSDMFFCLSLKVTTFRCKQSLWEPISIASINRGVDCFWKKLFLRCLIGFWMRLYRSIRKDNVALQIWHFPCLDFSSHAKIFLGNKYTLDLFIYLLTLFNVDYKTLAAYALIKIDYPPYPSHKKHNKNVN